MAKKKTSLIKFPPIIPPVAQVQKLQNFSSSAFASASLLIVPQGRKFLLDSVQIEGTIIGNAAGILSYSIKTVTGQVRYILIVTNALLTSAVPQYFSNHLSFPNPLIFEAGEEIEFVGGSGSSFQGSATINGRLDYT